MITDNHRIRFCENNFIPDCTIIDYSSQLTSFPFSNSYSDERSKIWKPSGYFAITAANNKFYINDGADKTATITIGEYTTPQLLATEIQTQLNAVSSGFTVTFEASFKFKIVRTSSFTLKLSTITNSIASTIGHTSLVDSVGTERTGDIIANHTSEFAIFDFRYAASVDFMAIIGNADEILSLSTTSEVKVYGNNLNDFTTPAFTKTLTRYDSGFFNFIDDADSAFRYWKIEIKDANNINGPSGFSIANIYMGDYQTLLSRNLENGFTKMFNDKSIKHEAESGALFFDKKQKFTSFDNVSLGLLEKVDRKMFETMFQKLGLVTPFYVAFDPTECFTDDLDDLTKFVVFDSEPNSRHVIRDIFSISISFRECV